MRDKVKLKGLIRRLKQQEYCAGVLSSARSTEDIKRQAFLQDEANKSFDEIFTLIDEPSEVEQDK